MDFPEMNFLKECVIESTRDDYESIATLEPEIRKWAEDEGKSFTTEALLAAITALVREGRLGAYRFAVDKGSFVEDTPLSNSITDLWFKTRQS
jgi:hypothetical protein